MRDSQVNWPGVIGLIVIVLFIGMVVLGLFFGLPAFGRYQALQNAENQVALNNIAIQQQDQLIAVEQKKAEIRVAEAQGISRSQQIINATLTDRYLVHEAIKAQEAMVSSPNHSTVYIPTGDMGVPIVRTENGDGR